MKKNIKKCCKNCKNLDMGSFTSYGCMYSGMPVLSLKSKCEKFEYTRDPYKFEMKIMKNGGIIETLVDLEKLLWRYGVKKYKIAESTGKVIIDVSVKCTVISALEEELRNNLPLGVCFEIRSSLRWYNLLFKRRYCVSEVWDKWVMMICRKKVKDEN